MKGMIFDIGWNTSYDGPGQRCVIYFKGCNFMCPWCANPEGMEFGIGTSGKEYSVEEIVAYVRRYKSFFGKLGGVTLTGGEPACQWEFLLGLVRKLKDENIHVAIETNGSSPNFPQLLNYLDLVICDMKHIDENEHFRLTGCSNKEVLSNIRSVYNKKIPLWVRIPIIPTYNDSITNIKGIAQFLSSIKDGVKVELLSYHMMGISKWAALGKKYNLEKISPPTKEYIKKLAKIFLRHRIEVIKT